jgi:hypothetical protein
MALAHSVRRQSQPDHASLIRMNATEQPLQRTRFEEKLEVIVQHSQIDPLLLHRKHPLKMSKNHLFHKHRTHVRCFADCSRVYYSLQS